MHQDSERLGRSSLPSASCAAFHPSPHPCFPSSGQLRTMLAAASGPSRPGTSKMRLITFIVAIFAASTPAGAQGWGEYEYPNETFTVAFPAEPKVETTSYRGPGGRLVEARVYSVLREGGEFKVMVADMSDTKESEGNVMAYAVFMLSRRGELKFNFPHAHTSGRWPASQHRRDRRQPDLCFRFLPQSPALSDRGDGARWRLERGRLPIPAIVRLHRWLEAA